MTRLVTEIADIDKKRCKIYINQEFAFVLYKRELLQYQISEDKEIDSSTYNEIVQDLLVKRAKKRCLYLLQKRPYTEQKLREKLREGFYPPEIEETAIEYVKSFHYVDDYEFACQYIFYHKDSETRRKMEEKLMVKGVAKDTLRQAFEDTYDDLQQQEQELKQAQLLLQKKKFDVQNSDKKEKRRIYAFLVRKGFGTSVIQKAMSLQDMV